MHGPFITLNKKPFQVPETVPEVIVPEIVPTKIVRDGKVAALVSLGYGAGWSSWCYDPQVAGKSVFCPQIVELVLHAEEFGWTEDHLRQIREIAASELGEDFYTGGADGLEIRWVPEGSLFRITEYDGAEGLVIFDEGNYFKA